MASTKYFTCLNCQVPLSIPPLVEHFAFPDALQPITDLLEGRINSIICPVCSLLNTLLTHIVVVNKVEKAILCCIPEGASYDEAELQQSAPDYQWQFCHNYQELYLLMVVWIEKYILSISQAWLSDTYEQLSLREEIELISPLFLRIFKGQVDGTIPFELQVSNGLSSEDAYPILCNLYERIIESHLNNLLTEAAHTQSLSALLAIVEEKIPRECITKQILADIAEQCLPFPDPDQYPQGFLSGFLFEYLNAIVHAHAKTMNPRRKIWAMYMTAIWVLIKNGQGDTIDSPFLLPPEVLQRILRFEDLWDVNMTDISDQEADRIYDVHNMIKTYGFEEEYARLLQEGQTFWFEKPEDVEKAKLLIELYKEAVLKRWQFNHTPEDSYNLGFMVGSLVGQLIKNSFSDGAITLIYDLLQQAIFQDDRVSAVSIVTHAIKWLNKFELYTEAYTLFEQVKDLANENDLIAKMPRLMLYYWNEVGNVFRYMHAYQAALKAYDLVAMLMSVVSDQEIGEQEIATFHTNLAIVYRETGHYTKALHLFQAELIRTPQDHSILQCLSLNYLAINQYEQALQYIERAIKLVQGGGYRHIRTNYLVTRGWIRQLQGLPDDGLQDLVEAFSYVPEDAHNIATRIAAAALHFYPQKEPGKHFIEQSKNIIANAISTQKYRHLSGNFQLTLLTALGMRLLKAGEAQAAKNLVEPEWEWLQQHKVQGSWQLNHLLGQIYYEIDNYQKCWPFIEAAYTQLDQDIPIAQEASFAPFWLQDKEEFQLSFATIAIDLVERGLLPSEKLLAVYEFINGREMQAKFMQENASESAARITLNYYLQRIHETGRNVDTFFFLDTMHSVKLMHIAASTGATTVIDDLSVQEIKTIKQHMREAFKWANPARLSSLDRRLKPWEDLSRRLGTKISPHIDEKRHVCFLPGRAFTGLPLHLIRLPNEAYVIEHHTVTYASNFTLLLTRGTPNTAQLGKMTIVAVTKEKDDENFRQRALQGAESLRGIFEKERSSFLLKEQEADYASVTEALSTSDEIVFICHGTTAGQERGYGICIAYAGHLPPSLLPVAELPELSHFILTWQDIPVLKNTPGIVVSIACSSGITEVVSGGVRFGLEQTLFSNGTRVIISPLWDVDQLSSLSWVEHFYRERSLHPDWHLDQVFQSTCLALQKRYSHPYFWGPFIFNGSLL